MSNFDFTGITKWDQIHGWFGLRKAIAVQHRVKQLPPSATVVELGSFHGRSSVAIAAVLPPNAVLHCVDHFKGSPEHHGMTVEVDEMLERFTENITSCGLRDRVRIVAANTLDAAPQFEDESVDLLLVDAAHEYESVRADLRAWYPKLKPGGFLFCDDYATAWPGVIKAVDEMRLEGSLAANALWFHIKPQTENE